MTGSAVPNTEAKIHWAQYPERTCRTAFSLDGLIDHTCDLPDMHPGPDAAKSSWESITRRVKWQDENPGWAKLIPSDDPFAGVENQLKENP